MRKTEFRKELARNLYAAGHSMEEIAARLKKHRTTVNNWRLADKKKGICWDRLRLERQLGEEEFRSKHQVFLYAMFDAFEKDLPGLNSLKDPEKRLDRLERYSNSYYKLMNAARREAPELAIAEVAGRTIEKVAQRAASDGRREILEWLLENLETIKSEIIREFHRQ